MLMSLWYRQLDRALVVAATRISPVTFHFYSDDESDDKRLLWLPWQQRCMQILQFLCCHRCDCLPWLQPPWPDPVQSHTVSVSCEFCFEMPSSFKCTSNVQLCRVGLRQMTWGLQKASKSWWKNSSQLSLMYPFFPPLWAGMCLPSPSRAFLYSCLRLSFVLSIYLQLPVIGFLLLVFLCLLLQDNYMNWD